MNQNRGETTNSILTKTTLLRLAVILAIPLIFSQCYLGKSRFKIRDYHHIEGISIGMPIVEAVKKADRKYTVIETKNEYIEGKHKDFKVFRQKDRKRLLFTFNGGFDKSNRDRVYRILIFDRDYLTPEGVHAGMTLSELRKSARLGPVDFNFTDGLFIKAANFDGGYWMDLKGVDTESLQLHPPKIEKLPGYLKVKAIALF